MGDTGTQDWRVRGQAVLGGVPGQSQAAGTGQREAGGVGSHEGLKAAIAHAQPLGPHKCCISLSISL